MRCRIHKTLQQDKSLHTGNITNGKPLGANLECSLDKFPSQVLTNKAPAHLYATKGDSFNACPSTRMQNHIPHRHRRVHLFHKERNLFGSLLNQYYMYVYTRAPHQFPAADQSLKEGGCASATPKRFSNAMSWCMKPLFGAAAGCLSRMYDSAEAKDKCLLRMM